MNEKELTQKIQEDGKAIKVWHLAKKGWDKPTETMCVYAEKDIDGFYLDRVEAVKAMQQEAKAIFPEKDVVWEVILDYAVISIEDINKAGSVLDAFRKHREFDGSVYVRYSDESLQAYYDNKK